VSLLALARRVEALGLDSRVRLTFATQIYSQLVTVAVQLVQVPLLLSAWGPSRYGGWLILYALPGYLTLTDFGFTFIAKNNMVMAAAANDRDAVLGVYHSVFALLLIIAAVFAGLTGLAVVETPLRSIADLGPISESAAKLVLATLIANVLVNQFFLLFCAVVRASGRPAAEVCWGATGRLLESVAVMTVAWVGAGVVPAAAAGLAVRVTYLVAIWAWLRVVASDLPLGLRRARLGEISAMVLPSLSYSMLGLAQALAIQGPVIILGAVASAGETAVFSTMRTLARLGTSAANLVNYSFSPEYSRLYGLGRLGDFARLERLHTTIGAAGTALYAVALWRLGPWIVTAWTHGAVSATEPLLSWLILSVAAEMLWTSRFSPLAATNRHVRLSNAFVVLTVICAPIACFCGVRWGAAGVAAALLALNVIMALLAFSHQTERREPPCEDAARVSET
jgi:O-antigen/teichoic acid export membrane protein